MHGDAPRRSVPDVSELDLEHAIGQVCCFGWSGTDAHTVNEHARFIVEQLGVGSVVLLSRNVSDPVSTRAMLEELQGLARIPLLVAIDHEGGMVCRFADGLHAFPGNMALEATSHPCKWTRLQARAQARELRAIGVNWNFAPCVDVNSNPDNPIIGVRSYGEDPQLVAALGVEAVLALQEEGVLACAKHFPGHGDTYVDSHLGLPVVSKNLETLHAVEILPFQAAVAEGTGSVMTTHILFPALDPERPATISPVLLDGLLRETLGYRGIVITDCLEMAAIAETIGTPQGAVRALQAGADVVLVCHTLDAQMETVRTIRHSVESGILSENRLYEAASRVLAAKRRYVRASTSSDPVWLDPEHDRIEEAIARESITLVRNSGAVPFPAGASVAVVAMHHGAGDVAQWLAERGVRTTPIVLDPDVSGVAMHEALAHVAQADRILALTAPREPWATRPIDQVAQAALIHKLHAQHPERLVVVAIREPFDIRRFPQIGTYMCTYGYQRCSLRALADALLGRFQPCGRLPVTIPLAH